MLFAVTFLTVAANSQLLKKIGDKIKNKTEEKTVNEAAKTDESAKPGDNSSSSDNDTKTTNNTAAAKDSTPANPTSFKTYANYDFIPGDKIIFEDNFSDDPDGEFPSHWDLLNGQGILNKINSEEAFCLTDGNYVRVMPLLKKKKYLGDQFTIEFDTYCTEGAYGVRIHLTDSTKQDIVTLQTNSGGVDCNFPEDRSLTGSFPEEMKYDNYFNKWHHYAIAFKNGQVKVYCDATRVLVIPNCNAAPDMIQFAGIGSVENPIIFKNIRVAEGGGMNQLGKKFTDTKIITHGINFDVNKTVIKPESMGTLNGIVQIMKENPEIKFEVGGHTDSDGDDASNQKLSQQRADAVRNQLITMGVDAGRLTSKGYGETKPIADNKTFEGKANNRRVEFVKQ